MDEINIKEYIEIEQLLKMEIWIAYFLRDLK